MNSEVKNYLNITWEDADTNAKVEGTIKRATGILCGLAGAETIDFEECPEEKQLFLDLCRYIYNNAYEDFKVNFAGDIAVLRARYSVSHFVQEQEAQANA